MNTQEINNIRIEDLVLWTENPRDPISPDSNDQDVADKAFEDVDGRWNLKKLISDMGEYYDYSELPIVVYDKGKPLVYDGNRRILLGKIKKGLIDRALYWSSRCFHRTCFSAYFLKYRQNC